MLNQITRLLQNSFVKASVISLGLLSLTALSTAATAGDAVRGEKIAQTCLGCHGAPLRNPSPVYSIPMLGGQHPEYIISALQAYKAETRSHGTMQAQTSNLSDQDMADIAAYFTSINDNPRPTNANAALISQGKTEAAVCAACHGANGDSDNTTYPKLAGQYESYLTQALKDYRSGERKNPIMSGFSANLTIHQIEALSAWFSSQEGGLSALSLNLRK